MLYEWCDVRCGKKKQPSAGGREAHCRFRAKRWYLVVGCFCRCGGGGGRPVSVAQRSSIADTCLTPTMQHTLSELGLVAI